MHTHWKKKALFPCFLKQILSGNTTKIKLTKQVGWNAHHKVNISASLVKIGQNVINLKQVFFAGQQIVLTFTKTAVQRSSGLVISSYCWTELIKAKVLWVFIFVNAKGNAQSIFLYNAQKLLVNFCLIKNIRKHCHKKK